MKCYRWLLCVQTTRTVLCEHHKCANPLSATLLYWHQVQPGLWRPDLTSVAKRKSVENSKRKIYIVCHIRVLFCITTWEHGTKISITTVHGNQTSSIWRYGRWRPITFLVTLGCKITKPLSFSHCHLFVFLRYCQYKCWNFLIGIMAQNEVGFRI